MVGNKLCSFIALYRYPSQLQDQFESFKDSLELNHESTVQDNPFVRPSRFYYKIKSMVQE